MGSVDPTTFDLTMAPNFLTSESFLGLFTIEAKLCECIKELASLDSTPVSLNMLEAAEALLCLGERPESYLASISPPSAVRLRSLGACSKSKESLSSVVMTRDASIVSWKNKGVTV